MDIYSTIRKLAKSNKHQNLFSASKEINNIQLFDNIKNLSNLQQLYINFLYFYENIIVDIMSNLVSEKVLDNDIYSDSYILWKKKDKKQDKVDEKRKDIHLIPAKHMTFRKKQGE